MRSFNLKKLAVISALGLVAILGTSEIAVAQGNRDDNQKQQQKDAKQRDKVAREQAKVEQKRQAEWTTRNTRMNNDNARNNRNFDVNTRVVVSTNNDRYRVYRNGSYYNTDNRGADLLRQAVNEGYRQGFAAGRSDRSNHRRSSWANSDVYRSGSIGYQSYVDRNQYQYYFQQGFQRGYQDGTNSRYQDGYNGNYDYGYYNNGTLEVIGSILDTVLNIASY